MKHLFLIVLAVLSFSISALAGPSLCGEAVSTSYAPVSDSGGTGLTINVTAPGGCTYSISSSAGWFGVTNGNSGTGNRTITFDVFSNQSFSARAGVIIVGRRTVTINQGAAKGGILAKRVPLDFNGDKVTDYVAIQNSGGRMIWWNYRYHIVTGPSITATSFGLFDEDIPVPNDFDGDFKTDFAVWRGGPGPNTQAYFYVLESLTNTVKYVAWGLSGDNPNVTQDFDGDFKADYAVTRKVSGLLYWYIWLSATNSFWGQQFGSDTDRPVRGDYDGDFHADLAVLRPYSQLPANTFLILRSRDDVFFGQTFGHSDIDSVVPGDYNGDDITDFAVWRTTTGTWFVRANPGSQTSGPITIFNFGQQFDVPVPGEYNANITSDYAVWRPGNPGVFYTQNTSGFPFAPVVTWGNSTFKFPAYSMQVVERSVP